MPKTLATATVDRLLHHAHLVLTKGDSHRLAEALTGKGVIPLEAATSAHRENTRPPAWKTDGRQPGENKATQPDFLMTVDSPSTLLREP